MYVCVCVCVHEPVVCKCVSHVYVGTHGCSLFFILSIGFESAHVRSISHTHSRRTLTYDQIKEITGINDNDQLVANFIETEDKNFALFNLVNELNNNIELLREQISDVESATKAYKEEIEVAAAERKKALVELERKLTEQTERCVVCVCVCVCVCV